MNWLDELGFALGDADLTVLQYHELVLLHELGHLFNVPQEPPNDDAYNMSILNDCILGLH